MPETNRQLKKRRITKPAIIVGALIAGFLLFLANTAVWVNRQVFNTENFTATAKSALLSDNSVDALSNEIVDSALSDRPIIKRIAGDTLVRVVGGLISSDQFAQIFNVVIGRAQSYLISPNQESVIIDLRIIKTPVENIIAVIGNATDNLNLNGQRVSQIPDQIVLLDAKKVPSLYGWSVGFLWAGPVFAVSALVILALPYFKRRVKWFYTLSVQGAAILLAGIFGLLVGPMIRPLVLGLMPGANIRIIVGNVFDAFIATFNAQSLWLIWGGIVMLAVGLIAVNWKGIVHLYQMIRREPRDIHKAAKHKNT